MPCGGLTPFLREIEMFFGATNSIVSMPCGGLTPFLPLTPAAWVFIHIFGVNALWRAYSISTSS